MKRILKQTAIFVALLPGILSAALFAPPTYIEGDSDHPFEMGYEKDGVRFGFYSDGEEVTLALEIGPDNWNTLNSAEQALFQQTGNGHYLFGYTNSYKNPWIEAEGIFERRDASRFGTPLECVNATPVVVDQMELQDWVDGKRVLFYSGAGISKACGIPDMKGLEAKLGIASNIMETVTLWVNSPELIGDNVASFYSACRSGDPSKSHFILSHLAFFTNQQILTENLDQMQEKMSTRPLRISKLEMEKSDEEEEVDAIICVGLSNDDKGFLKVMKQTHPHLKIIAINPACPIYLGSEDFWCPMCAHSFLDSFMDDALTKKLTLQRFNRS